MRRFVLWRGVAILLVVALFAMLFLFPAGPTGTPLGLRSVSTGSSGTASAQQTADRVFVGKHIKAYELESVEERYLQLLLEAKGMEYWRKVKPKSADDREWQRAAKRWISDWERYYRREFARPKTVGERFDWGVRFLLDTVEKTPAGWVQPWAKEVYEKSGLRDHVLDMGGGDHRTAGTDTNYTMYKLWTGMTEPTILASREVARQDPNWARVRDERWEAKTGASILANDAKELIRNDPDLRPIDGLIADSGELSADAGQIISGWYNSNGDLLERFSLVDEELQGIKDCTGDPDPSRCRIDQVNRIKADNQKYRALIAGGHAVLSIFTNFADLVDRSGETSRKIDAVGGGALQVCEAIIDYTETMADPGDLGPLVTAVAGAALTANLVGVGIGIANAFLGAGDDIQKEIRDAVEDLKDQVNDLQGELRDRFDRVDQALNGIMAGVIGQLELLSEVDAKVEDVQETLSNLHTDINELERNLFDIQAAATRTSLWDAIDYGIGWKARHTEPLPYVGRDGYVGLESQFYKWTFRNWSGR